MTRLSSLVPIPPSPHLLCSKALRALSVAALVVALAVAAPPDVPVYKNSEAPIAARVSSLLSLMTLEEKVAQLVQPWTAPDGNNYNDLLAQWGKTSLGCVYGFWPGLLGDQQARQQDEAHNDLQVCGVTCDTAVAQWPPDAPCRPHIHHHMECRRRS